MKKERVNFILMSIFVVLLQACSHIPFIKKNDENNLIQDTDTQISTDDFKKTARSNKIKQVTQVDVANDYYKSLVTENYVLNNLDMYNKLENLIKNSMNFKNSPTNESEATLDPTVKTENSVKSNLNPQDIKNSRNISSTQKKKILDASTYKVKNGDTLMKIAFEKYGDLTRWRDIYSDNQDQLGQHFSLIQPGLVIKLRAGTGVSISKNGKPYLILKNDTLSLISNKLYGQSRYWSSLWHNNPELISNPNKIYSGFTLYYLGLDQIKSSSMASNKKKSTNSTALNFNSNTRTVEKADFPNLKNENRIPANLKEEE